MTGQIIDFNLNGEPTSVTARVGESLLETLRNRCGILSPKDGCQPQGQCGCCLVLIDGSPKVSCVVPAAKVEGKEVLTLEGLPEEERKLIAEAFVSSAGLQCGYCIPGFALQTKRILDLNPEPTREQIARGLNGHLCRCTGYLKIIDAIEAIAAAKRGEPRLAVETDGGVGANLARFEGAEMVLGDRPYIDDMQRIGRSGEQLLLEGAVLLSPHARAKVVSIDTAKAKAHPGVVAVATAEDVPGDRWVGLLYPDWPIFVAVGEEARCVGDVIAAVAAVDEQTAREAVELIEVEYEVLEPVLDPEAAMAEGAPQVNPRHENVLSVTRVERGDAEAALEASAHVVSGTWTTQRIEHLYLEPESALAEPIPESVAGPVEVAASSSADTAVVGNGSQDGGPQMRLYSQGQGIFDDRRQVADVLGIDKDQLAVELVPNGGAFGGKEDMSIQAQTALLAQMTGKPVRITLNREESIRLHPKRHPITMHYKVGCDDEGRLTAVVADMVGDTGAYASVGSKVLERAAGHSCGPYRVPNVSVIARAVMTNNPPCGAMRGFGANQAHFGIDGALDLLAERVGIDTWEMRWRNIVDVGDMTATGQVLEKSVGVRKTLEAVKEAYYEAKTAGRAVGIACGMKNSGIGNGALEWGKARLVVEDDGTVSLYNGYTEMGQGLLTVLVQCAVEVTGLPASIFKPKVDSTFDLDCGQTTGSRGTMLGGLAVKDAAEKLKADLDAMEASVAAEVPVAAAGGDGHSSIPGLGGEPSTADPAELLATLAGRVYEGEVLIDDTTAPGKENGKKIKTHTSYAFATQVCILDEEGRVERFVAAHDVGRAINPALCEGQVEGSVHMGLGYALTEELPCPDGMPATFKLRELGVLRAADMPEVDVMLIEEHEPEGPFGAKGVGEIGLVPTASAVAGALAAYDGIRRFSLPMKDSPAAKAMSVGRIRG